MGSETLLSANATLGAIRVAKSEINRSSGRIALRKTRSFGQACRKERPGQRSDTNRRTAVKGLTDIQGTPGKYAHPRRFGRSRVTQPVSWSAPDRWTVNRRRCSDRTRERQKAPKISGGMHRFRAETEVPI